MKNYLVFGMDTLYVSQNYYGKTSHYPHTYGSPIDYPIDVAGKDTGRDWFYCPCDEMEIKKIYGYKSRGTNTVWAQSTSKVYFANGEHDYAVIQFTHPDDEDLSKLKVGQKFKRGEKMMREGKDGATGNHIHLSVCKGTFKSSGWVKNTNGKWVCVSTNGPIKPENAFYIKPDIKIRGKGGLNWKTLPEEPKYNYIVSTGNDTLTIRKGPGTTYDKVGSLQNNTKIKVIETKNNWGKIANNQWVCLDYCNKLYIVDTSADGGISLNVRKGPGTSYDVVEKIKNGTIIGIGKQSNGWGEIEKSKWIKMSYCKNI